MREDLKTIYTNMYIQYVYIVGLPTLEALIIETKNKYADNNKLSIKFIEELKAVIFLFLVNGFDIKERQIF